MVKKKIPHLGARIQIRWKHQLGEGEGKEICKFDTERKCSLHKCHVVRRYFLNDRWMVPKEILGGASGADRGAYEGMRV